MHMNEPDPNVSTVLKSAQLLHAALTLGLITFGAVVLFLMLSGSDPMAAEESTSSRDNAAFDVLGIAAPIGATVIAFLIRVFLGRVASGMNASAIIMGRHIVFIAILEGGGLMGIVVSLISDSPAGLIAAALPLIALLATWPTRARFDPDHDPRIAWDS